MFLPIPNQPIDGPDFPLSPTDITGLLSGIFLIISEFLPYIKYFSGNGIIHGLHNFIVGRNAVPSPEYTPV